MQLIKDMEFGGERPLFGSHDLHLDHVTVRAGESAIKECSNIIATNCRFEGNYPFWHVHGFVIDRCFFDVGGRSALWYSDHLKMTDTRIDAPKMFREMTDIEIENVEINDADEVFWRCNRLDIKNLKLHDGRYPFMFSRNIRIDGLESDSKYVFQYVKQAVFRCFCEKSIYKNESAPNEKSITGEQFFVWRRFVYHSPVINFKSLTL